MTTNPEYDVIINWTDIRHALPERPGWCLINHTGGLGGYGYDIRSAWWNGKNFEDGTPNHTEYPLLDYSHELSGELAGVLGWAYLYRHNINGVDHEKSLETWKPKE